MNDKDTSGEGGRGGNASVRGNDNTAQGGCGGEGVVGPGGPGGDAIIAGDNNVAVGGPGGRGGLGEGGPGGRAEVLGNNKVVAGGEGGEAGQMDGRGGRGGRSGFHFVRGRTDYRPSDEAWLGEYGRGGDGGSSLQYSARLMVIEEILGRPITMRASSAGFIDAKTCSVILHRLNERLGCDQHAWRVRITAGCFDFYDIT